MSFYYRRCLGFQWDSPYYPKQRFQCWDTNRSNSIIEDQVERNISTVEDRIHRWLQHHYKACCKKGGHHGRQACIIGRWYHYRDIISGWVDLAYNTYSRTFYNLLCVIWSCDMWLLQMSHFVTCATVTHNIISYFSSKSKIIKMKIETKIK